MIVDTTQVGNPTPPVLLNRGQERHSR